MVQKTAQNGDRLDARRREILAVASGLFRSSGFHSTGMRDIAAAASMTVGNLYYYFENKQDLLAFCQEDAVRRLLDIASQVEALELDAPRSLWLMIVAHIRCLNEGVPGSLAHLEVGELEPAARRRIVRLRDRYEAMLRSCVERGMHHGLFAATDAPLATQVVLGAANATVQWYRPKGRMSLDHIARSFATQLVRGLLRPGVDLEPPEEELLESTAPVSAVAQRGIL